MMIIGIKPLGYGEKEIEMEKDILKTLFIQ